MTLFDAFTRVVFAFLTAMTVGTVVFLLTSSAIVGMPVTAFVNYKLLKYFFPYPKRKD